MNKVNLDKYFVEFNEKFKDLQEINAQWHESNLNLKAFICSKAKIRDSKNNFSEEYKSKIYLCFSSFGNL
jgi:hypothetical protein